jgi:hypothetical protein
MGKRFLILSASTHGLFSSNSEFGVIIAGLLASSLAGFIYFSPLLTVAFIASRKLRGAIESKGWKILLATWFASLASLIIGETCLSPTITMAATGFLV